MEQCNTRPSNTPTGHAHTPSTPHTLKFHTGPLLHTNHPAARQTPCVTCALTLTITHTLGHKAHQPPHSAAISAMSHGRHTHSTLTHTRHAGHLAALHTQLHAPQHGSSSQQCSTCNCSDGYQLPKPFFNRALKKCRSIDRCPDLRLDNGSLPTHSFSSYPRRHLFWLRPCFFRCSSRGDAALRVFGMGRRRIQPAHSLVALQPCAFAQPRR